MPTNERRDAEEIAKELRKQFDAGVELGWREGYRIAIEEAAKICDKPIEEALVSRIPGYVLAERIRALASKDHGEGVK